eukprot:10603134-Alexandrium_andersonii.AAC.1
MEYGMSGFLGQCYEVFTEHLNVSISSLGVGSAVALLVAETIREISQREGRCPVCKGQCRSGNLAQ